LKKIQGKGGPNHSGLSPIKKEILPKRANQMAKADINLSAADGPRAGAAASQAYSENNLFNKHYNKELKLCEGKCSIL
jgi:hypothetical protein